MFGMVGICVCLVCLVLLLFPCLFVVCDLECVVCLVSLVVLRFECMVFVLCLILSVCLAVVEFLVRLVCFVCLECVV